MSSKLLTAIILYTDAPRGSKTKQCRSLCDITKKTTLIEQQIRLLKKNNNQIDIIIVAGKGYKDLDKTVKNLKYKNVNVVHEQNYTELNQSQILIDLIRNKNIKNNILVILGEILFKNTNLKKISKTTVWLIDKHKDGFNIHCRQNNSNAEYFFYDIPNEKQWAEIIFLDTASVSAILHNISQNTGTKQLFIFEILNILTDKYRPINTEIIQYKDILKVKNQKDINKAKVFIR